MEKKSIYLGMIMGGIIGGYIPTLWGAGFFSFSSIICGTIGAILGVWLIFKILR